MGEVAPIMDDHRAHVVLSQSVAGQGTEACRFEGDGTIFIRKDFVLKAMRNAASYAAEQIAGFFGVFPARDLIRRLDLGEATPPEQLEAAIRLRLMNAPGPEFRGIRITIEAQLNGSVGLHTQGFNMLGTETERLLDAAAKSLAAEIDDFRHCPFHSKTASREATARKERP
jgi:hypothetical protein